MVQRTMWRKDSQQRNRYEPEFAEAIGLTCEEQTVTLRFMGDTSCWGQPTREVRLDRQLAEQFLRLLNDELERGEWALRESNNL